MLLTWSDVDGAITSKLTRSPLQEEKAQKTIILRIKHSESGPALKWRNTGFPEWRSHSQLPAKSTSGGHRPLHLKGKKGKKVGHCFHLGSALWVEAPVAEGSLCI